MLVVEQAQLDSCITSRSIGGGRSDKNKINGGCYEYHRSDENKCINLRYVNTRLFRSLDRSSPTIYVALKLRIKVTISPAKSLVPQVNHERLTCTSTVHDANYGLVGYETAMLFTKNPFMVPTRYRTLGHVCHTDIAPTGRSCRID